MDRNPCSLDEYVRRIVHLARRAATVFRILYFAFCIACTLLYTHDTYVSPYPRPTTTSSSLTRPLPYFRKAKKALASSHRSKAIRIITFDRATTSGGEGGVRRGSSATVEENKHQGSIFSVSPSKGPRKKKEKKREGRDMYVCRYEWEALEGRGEEVE